MRVTVCQLRDTGRDLERDFEALVAHARDEKSDLVLFPEMPFCPWIASRRPFEPAAWNDAIAAHDTWHERLDELAPATVVGSRPVSRDGRRLNEGFLREPGIAERPMHAKYYLPDEEGFWEATWYERGAPVFSPVRTGGIVLGMLICTEMWFTEHCRTYARAGVHVLASPRAVGAESVEKWIAGGRTAAVMSGAYCLSSNRGGVDARGTEWGGAGWIIEPEEGEVLALTSPETPFVTLAIDPDVAEAAKKTYPRYVRE